MGRKFYKSKNFVSASLIALALIHPLPTFAQSGPQNLHINGSLMSPGGNPLTNSSVNFRIEILDSNGICVLYREDHLGENLANTKGGFSLEIGNGTSRANNIDLGSSTAMSLKVFENNGATGAFPGCPAGVNLASGDNRMVRIYYDIGSGFVAMTPDAPIGASAYAMFAESLQGKRASDFVQVRDDATYDLTQTNLESIFSAVNFAKLTQILSGNWGNTTLTNVGTPSAGTDAANKNYVDANIGGKIADVTTVGPAAGNGHTLIWDQAQNRWVTGVPSATDNTKLPLAGGTMTGAVAMGAQNITNIGHMTMAAQRTLNLGTYDDTQEGVLVGTLGLADKGKIWFNSQANVFKVWNGTAAVSTFGASGAAGGDLTGTYPNPTLANGSVTAAKINNTGIAVNRLLITDATTGVSVTYKTCALDETLKWTATGWACSTAAAFIGNTGVTAATYGNATQVSQMQVDAQGRIVTASNVNIDFPVVSVAGKTGAITLNSADISGLGTAAVKAFGTAAGNLVELDGGGKIPTSLLPSGTGDIGDVVAGSGLTGGGSSGAVTLAVDTGVTSGKIVAVGASDKLPAIDGSNLTQVNAIRLQARDVAATAPTAAQVLTWNAGSSAWEPQTLPAGNTGDMTSVTAGTGLLGGSVSGDATIAIDVGTTTGQIVQMAASNKLPAVDGSDLTQINAVRLQSRSLAATAPTASQVLAWNAGSSTWEPQTVSIAGGGGFVQDGNSFGATTTLGTNDNFALNLETNGATALTILPSGNVGIGSTSPDSKLKIVHNMVGTPDSLTLFNPDIGYASGTGSAIEFEGGANLTSARITSMWDNNSGNANFAINVRGGGVLNSAIQVYGSGNTIRLGGNIPSGSVPGKVHINDSSTTGNTVQKGLSLLHIDSNSGGANGIGISIPFYAESSADGTYSEIGRIESVLDDASDNSKDSSLRFFTLAENSPTGTNTTTEKMRIHTNGNVGVGTTNPQSLLHVNGVVRATDICDENGANCKDISGGWGGGGDIDGVYSGAGLVGGFASGSGTLSVDVGTTTGKIVQMAASDKLPALDGSNLTAINAVQLQARNIAAIAPTAGQVLLWNAGTSVWEPGNVAGATAADSLDFTDFTDNMALDASTNIAVDNAEEFSITNIGTGNSFVVNDQASDTTPFIIDSNGNVGLASTSGPAAVLHIGQEVSAAQRLRVNANPYSVTGSFDPNFFDTVYNSSTVNSGTLTGIRNKVQSASTRQDTYLYGLYNRLEVVNTGGTLEAAGTFNDVVTGAASGTVTSAFGNKQIVTNSNTATLSDAYGTHVDVRNTGGGTLTNAYGVYVDSLSGTNRWGIYQAGASDNNYFAGSVGIGTTTPSDRLTVQSGNIAASGGQIYSTVQTSSVASPLTFNTNSGNLMVWSTATASPTVNIHNMKAGGSYMLVVNGTGTGTVTLNCFSDAGTTTLPSSFVPANGGRVAGTLNKTIYTLVSDGTNCLVTWITGF